MNVKIDGNTVFSVTQADAPSYPTYTRVSVDVGAFADGGMHNLRFESTTQPGPGITNFFVDDITIELCDEGGQEPDKIGVKRGSSWFLDRNGNGAWDGCGTDACYTFGNPNDKPIAGDWNGDGFDEIGVQRGNQWFLDLNGNGVWNGCGTDGCYTFGNPGDQPTTGNWDKDNVDEIGVKRGVNWYLDNGNGVWNGCGSFPGQDVCRSFGAPNDLPVAGDWSAGGFGHLGTKRGANWFLDLNGNDTWNGCGIDACYTFGVPTDKPVSGDWNNDGTDGIGTKRGVSWFLDRNDNGVWNGCVTDACYTFGAANDAPVTGRWAP
jgi:hypothetical protein